MRNYIDARTEIGKTPAGKASAACALIGYLSPVDGPSSVRRLEGNLPTRNFAIILYVCCFFARGGALKAVAIMEPEWAARSRELCLFRVTFDRSIH